MDPVPARAYLNPILPGFHPDPSLCRVGPDHYLATSSFHWFPGVPIHHSRDLVHWRLLGYALDRQKGLSLRSARTSGGIYAPTLRYHDGRFYLITTQVDGGGNFYVTASDPAGPWSDPVWLPDLPGIDPSLFFNDDGRVYVQSTGAGQGIVQAELDVARGRLVQVPRLIWSGTGGRYPEGPHLYRICGRYYLMIAEGGTEYGHMETIARADTPWGPFESAPRNPILTHRNTNDHVIQGTGHADLFQAEDGNWWLVFLGFRTVGGPYHHLGRETFLAPVSWTDDGWPVVNAGRTIEERMQGPLPPDHPWPAAPLRGAFAAPRLGPEWTFLRRPLGRRVTLTGRPGWLRLYAAGRGLDSRWPVLAARRQEHMTAEVSTLLELRTLRAGDEAGLTVYMDERHHAEVFLFQRGSRRCLGLRQRIGELSAVRAAVPVRPGPVVLRVSARRERYRFLGGALGERPRLLGEAAAKYLSSEVAGGFTGVHLGIYAVGRAQADFARFEVRPGRTGTEG